MTDKEKLAKKIMIKEASGLDYTGGLTKAAVMAFSEERASGENERIKKLNSILKDDMDKLPPTTSKLGLIRVKLDNIEKNYEIFYDAYKKGNFETWELYLDYLSALGFNILWDTEGLCDTENPSFDVKKTRGHLVNQNAATIEGFIEAFPDFMDEAYASLTAGGEKTYLEVGNLTLLLSFYGMDARYNHIEEHKKTERG